MTRRQLYLACANLGVVDFGLEHIDSLFQIASKQREITGASILVSAPQASGSASTRTDNDKGSGESSEYMEAGLEFCAYRIHIVQLYSGFLTIVFFPNFHETICLYFL